MAQNFHKFCKKIFLRETIIVNITAHRVIIFDIFLIREIKMQKSYFEAFHGNLVPQKFCCHSQALGPAVSTFIKVFYFIPGYSTYYGICLVKLHTSENPSIVTAGCEGDAATGSVPISGSCSFEEEAPAGMLGILCRYP